MAFFKALVFTSTGSVLLGIKSVRAEKKILLAIRIFLSLFLSKVKHIQMIGASATVNDVLQEDLTEIGWGDHVKLIQSSTLEGWPCKVPPCIKHQYVICDESVGLTKAQALAR